MRLALRQSDRHNRTGERYGRKSFGQYARSFFRVPVGDGAFKKMPRPQLKKGQVIFNLGRGNFKNTPSPTEGSIANA